MSCKRTRVEIPERCFVAASKTAAVAILNRVQQAHQLLVTIDLCDIEDTNGIAGQQVQEALEALEEAETLLKNSVFSRGILVCPMKK
jgi:hypothetical protein